MCVCCVCVCVVCVCVCVVCVWFIKNTRKSIVVVRACVLKMFSYLCDESIVLHDFASFHGADDARFNHRFSVLVNFDHSHLECLQRRRRIKKLD